MSIIPFTSHHLSLCPMSYHSKNKHKGITLIYHIRAKTEHSNMSLLTGPHTALKTHTMTSLVPPYHTITFCHHTITCAPIPYHQLLSPYHHLCPHTIPSLVPPYHTTYLDGTGDDNGQDSQRCTQDVEESQGHKGLVSSKVTFFTSFVYQ